MARQKFSYSEALNEIESIIHQIENDELDIDKLSDKVKKASALIKKCKNKLRETENDINQIFEDE